MPSRYVILVRNPRNNRIIAVESGGDDAEIAVYDSEDAAHPAKPPRRNCRRKCASFWG